MLTENSNTVICVMLRNIFFFICDSDWGIKMCDFFPPSMSAYTF